MKRRGHRVDVSSSSKRDRRKPSSINMCVYLQNIEGWIFCRTSKSSTIPCQQSKVNRNTCPIFDICELFGNK